MSPRRRAVERATRRQQITDRIVIGTLVLVALSGLMSVLPAYTQVAVSRFACRVGSLGLGSCGAPGINLGNTQLAPARCTVLGTLDKALPEVRVEQVTTSQGLPVTISQARSGDVFVALGDADQPSAPDLLAGEARAPRTVLPGVAVPGQAEWFLPRGQGLDQLVTAAHGEHQQWFERQSALALVGSRLFGPHQEVPPPACCSARCGWTSRGCRATATGRHRRRPRRAPKRRTGPVAAVNSLRLDPTVPALAVVNRISGTTATVASLRGTLRQRPVTGALRWTRNADGVITSVLVAVVGDFRLVPGEKLGSLPGPAVAYVSIPVTTPPEQRLVQAWLADPAGVTVPLDRAAPAPPGPDLRPARVVPDPRGDRDDPAVRLRRAGGAAGPDVR